MIGLQLFPYDVADEGAEALVDTAVGAGANVLLPAVTYVRESQPVPGGELPPHRRHRRYETDGGAYFEPDLSRYPSALAPVVTSEQVDGEHELRALSSAAADRDVTIVPWVQLLKGRVADIALDSCATNARDEVVPGWLCPSRPETAGYVEGLVSDVAARFEPGAVFIDRFRFPEWGPHGLIDACACFCTHCVASAEELGVDMKRARTEVLEVVEHLTEQPAAGADSILSNLTIGLRVMQTLGSYPALFDFLVFRQIAIERIVKSAARALSDSRAELWLDVWPPSYGWLLGQDLARLAPYGTWTKPFTYHRLAGGADIAGLIASLAKQPDERDALYRAYREFFGFPGPERFEEFVERGLDPLFITTETEYTRRLLAGRSKLAAGLQLWQLGPEGVESALEHASRVETDGIILFCYGWATREELAAAGDWLRRAGLADRG